MADGADQSDTSGILASAHYPSAPRAYASPQAADGVAATNAPDITIPDSAPSTVDTGNTPEPQDHTPSASPPARYTLAAGPQVASSQPDASTGADSTASGENGQSPQPAPADDAANAYNRGRAAFIIGALAHLSPQQASHDEMADYFQLPPYLIAANPTGFQRRMRIITSRDAMADCSVLPQFIVNNPPLGPQIGPHIASLSNLEKFLSSRRDDAREATGAIGEPILHWATAMFAKTTSDLYGLGRIPYEAVTGNKNAGNLERDKQALQRALTYQPRTDAGRSPINPLNSIPAWFAKLFELMLPDKPADGDTLGGAARNFVREGVPQALAIAGAKMPIGERAAADAAAVDAGGADAVRPPTDDAPPRTDVPPENNTPPKSETPPEGGNENRPENQSPDSPDNPDEKSWADTHPPLPPEQIKVPGGGLRAHEETGDPNGPHGHTLKKHVDKTKDDLVLRNTEEPNVPASSSFYNEATAEEAISAALKANEAKIEAWVKSGCKGRAPRIQITMPKPVGITVPQGAEVARPAFSVNVVIRKAPNSPLKYYILTGYPQ